MKYDGVIINPFYQNYEVQTVAIAQLYADETSTRLTI